MSVRGLSVLGRLASGLRRVGLGPAFSIARDAIDRLFRSLGLPPPLTAAPANGLRLRGYFRHRGFLHNIGARDYESLARRLYETDVASADVVVDGGAHIGLYSR